MSEYLRMNRPELAPEELDTLERLEKLILSNDTVRSDRNIDGQAGISSRSVRKIAQHHEI